MKTQERIIVINFELSCYNKTSEILALTVSLLLLTKGSDLVP